jgi:hypothetical protein
VIVVTSGNIFGVTLCYSCAIRCSDWDRAPLLLVPVRRVIHRLLDNLGLETVSTHVHNWLGLLSDRADLGTSGRLLSLGGLD